MHNNGKENLGKFDARSDEGIFLCYSSLSKAYKVYNKRTMKVEESMHVVFDETEMHDSRGNNNDDDDQGFDFGSQGSVQGQVPPVPDASVTPDEKHDSDVQDGEVLPSNNQTQSQVVPVSNQPGAHYRDHPVENILSDLSRGVQTRSQIRTLLVLALTANVSQMEPKNVSEALQDS